MLIFCCVTDYEIYPSSKSNTMEINYYLKLDLSKSTEITIIRPKKRKKRKNNDTYDFDDKLIENMENDDELVFIETELKNFFVYMGELQEPGRKILRKYNQKNKNPVKKENLKLNESIFAEHFSTKIMNYYKEKIQDLQNKLKENCKKKEKNKEKQTNKSSNTRINENNIEQIISDLIILETMYTTKTFDEISQEIVALNGPLIDGDFINKISSNLKIDIQILSTNLESKFNDLLQKNEKDEKDLIKFDKNLIFSICDLVDKKMKKYFVELLMKSEMRKTTRKLKRDFHIEILKPFDEKNADNIKKLIAKFDFMKQKRRLASA